MQNSRHKLWRLSVLSAAMALLMACSQSAQAPAQAGDFAQDTPCALDGMVLADYPGPKGQILYADGQTEFFCDTVELIAALLHPEQQRKRAGAWVNDMGKADWDAPRGHWIEAQSAVYVKDSRKRGAMGPTLVPFAEVAAAQAFITKEGGKLLHFNEINADAVALDGGALHDTRSH